MLGATPEITVQKGVILSKEPSIQLLAISAEPTAVMAITVLTDQSPLRPSR
jgi:hypothetical protein